MKYIIKYKTSIDSSFFAYIVFVPSLISLIIGILFLIPPILGVIAFIGELFGASGSFFDLLNLSTNWTCFENGMSAAPIYLGLMALSGSAMIYVAYYIFLKAIEVGIRDESKIESVETE